MNIDHLSVSRKKCHDDCPQKYKYRYHLKVPAPGPEPFFFTYGKIVHKIAEEYVRGRGKISIDIIKKDILNGKIEMEDGTEIPKSFPKDYNRKLIKHVKGLETLNNKMGFDGELEYEFHHDLDPPNNKEIMGFIDRLIIRGDKAYIIDYKTTKKSKWRVNKHTVTQDLQLRTYALVVWKKFNIDPVNIKSALFYLEGEELVGASFTEKSLIETEKVLHEAYKQIEESNPENVWGRVGMHCKFCDYQGMCPFYKASKPAPAWDGDLSKIK